MARDRLLRLHEFEELIGVDLKEPARAGVETLGGLVVALLDRHPQVGDEVLVTGRRVRVEQLQGRRISVVRLLARTAGGADRLTTVRPV